MTFHMTLHTYIVTSFHNVGMKQHHLFSVLPCRRLNKIMIIRFSIYLQYSLSEPPPRNITKGVVRKLYDRNMTGMSSPVLFIFNTTLYSYTNQILHHEVL